MMRPRDQCLGSTVIDRSQHRHGLRDRERKVETGNWCTSRLRCFLSLNQPRFCRTLFCSEGFGEFVCATLDPLCSGGELPVRATTLLTRGRILSVTDEPPQLVLRHRVPISEIARES